MDTFDAKLLKRVIGQKKTHQSIKPLYGDRQWVEDLDIVNELGGHTGCVNALSWSSSGHLLASGSDDTYLNIWDYNPANLAKPFTLNTSVSTGHTNNIFSVKFMPHSNDRTVVTCAGDSEVRVFDLEYGGSGGSHENNNSNTRSRRFNTFFGSAKWLNEGSTNARVYRSHSDRAKRIVTESSPHLFLSCSEDGEVRQWDLRQPSSAYPAPHGARRTRMRMATVDDEPGNVPPPLISYKRYNLDLNSISCSATQPHYIALGGAHLHCFLHDRRMMGRDISNEQGKPAGRIPAAGTAADESMREATRCVRRFAPHNKRKMGPRDTGHITSCKISNARPNELISSWSGDHIYSFDIVKSPDARDVEARQNQAARAVQLRDRSERKRKRAAAGHPSVESLGTAASRRTQGAADTLEAVGETVTETSTQRGHARIFPTIPEPLDESYDIHDALLTEAQIQSARIARSLVQLRKTLFDFSALLNQQEMASMEHSSELTPFTTAFTTAIGQASSLLPQMEDVMRSWSYPVNPTEEDITFSNTLRNNRQRSWRFVQAAGCLARTLGGKLQTTSVSSDPRLARFDMIKPAPNDNKQITPASRFSYDFLKAILLWLDGGASAVLDGFRKSARVHGDNSMFPLTEDDTTETIPEKICNFLMSSANDQKPIIDIETNRFERDEFRSVFSTQPAAVQAFTRALAGIELRDRQGTSELDTGPSGIGRIMDKGAAVRFWGLRVGRSLLLDAAEGVNFAMVRQSFGGPRSDVLSELENWGHAPHILSGEDRSTIPSVGLTGIDEFENGSAQPQVLFSAPVETLAEVQNISPQVNDINDQDYEEVDANIQEDESDVSDPDEEESDDDGPAQQMFRRGAAYGRSRQRSTVNTDVPYTSHTRMYKGHCNTRTVKDVNYYGLDDEYIVSGSDDGHFFIWDRKTSQVLNILEGDGEVVNVVQGHPYEPMIACSGIDSTVKIFGPGGSNRERYDAMTGTNIANPGGSVHSSLHFGRRARRSSDDDEDEAAKEEDHNRHLNTDEDEPVLARNGLKSRRALNSQYEITSQNDVMRREGNGDAFVTEGMLARLAAALQQGGQIPGVVGEDGTIVIDQENCLVM